MAYLFVIDYQKDFVDGALGFPGAEKLDEKIAAKVRAYGPGKVFFTRDTHWKPEKERICPLSTASRAVMAGRSTVRPLPLWKKWAPEPSTSWSSVWM